MFNYQTTIFNSVARVSKKRVQHRNFARLFFFYQLWIKSKADFAKTVQGGNSYKKVNNYNVRIYLFFTFLIRVTATHIQIRMNITTHFTTFCNNEYARKSSNNKLQYYMYFYYLHNLWKVRKISSYTLLVRIQIMGISVKLNFWFINIWTNANSL